MLTKRAQKLISISVITGIGSVVAFAGSLYYIYTQSQELHTKAQALADYSTQEQTYRRLAALLEESSVERQELKTYFLGNAETIDFLAEIESLERISTVDVTMNALTEQAGNPYITLFVDMSITGPEAEVFEIIKILEALPYASYIKTLRIVDDITEPGMVDATLQLAVMLTAS